MKATVNQKKNKDSVDLWGQPTMQIKIKGLGKKELQELLEFAKFYDIQNWPFTSVVDYWMAFKVISQVLKERRMVDGTELANLIAEKLHCSFGYANQMVEAWYLL